LTAPRIHGDVSYGESDIHTSGYFAEHSVIAVKRMVVG